MFLVYSICVLIVFCRGVIVYVIDGYTQGKRQCQTVIRGWDTFSWLRSLPLTKTVHQVVPSIDFVVYFSISGVTTRQLFLLRSACKPVIGREGEDRSQSSRSHDSARALMIQLGNYVRECLPKGSPCDTSWNCSSTEPH